ncbi:CRISPR-associated endonuclease Cas2 [Paenibacillus profundus]|uniref:CRISPR-associated endoribonuclease Cas2 n=1 Tax=Paenibacillus profundus TaxID=1173085 RepID=A0ABS8YNX7_9BACL|nr:CRISPR-associated endonuclease Cas2 [Paenibacillus profundus]MCE5173525.1 CRISPR-associated endonuclease Cas2 [Paenibacillus profundus]
MMVLVTYDVNTQDAEGRRRLRQVAKACVNVGQRVQNSVFECKLDPLQFAQLKKHIDGIIDSNKDSVRYYRLGNNWTNRVEHVGVKETYNPEGTLII